MTGRGPRALLAAAILWASAALAGEMAAQEKAPQTQTLRGFDLDLTLTEASGLLTASDAYENVLAVSLDPRFYLGRRFFKNGWGEPLTLSANLTLDAELSGNDPSYRSQSFASPALLKDSPERVQLAQATQAGALMTPDHAVEGATRRAVLSDLKLALAHDKVVTLPTVGLDVAAGARVVLPLSSASRNTGLRAAPSLSMGLHRALGPFELRWDLRGTAYLFAATTPSIAGPGGTVRVNGQEVEPYRPATTGVPNPSQAMVNTLSASVELPRHLSVAAEYSLINTWAYPLTACAVPGVPTADVCRDGPTLGMVQAVGQRDSQSFWVEAGWKPAAWGSLGLGLSTMRPLRAPDGQLANPFLQVNRDNYSSVYLALSVNAEALASTLHRAPEASK